MSKRYVFLVLVILGCLLLAGPAFAQCAKIKDGTIFDSAGNRVTLGYDKYGYNYQAHMFNGLYENYSRPSEPVSESDTNLIMKWSDDWLSNQDCFDDQAHLPGQHGKLDRGNDGTGSSKGWLTNHMEGDYPGDDGEMHHYTYFVKIVWVGPATLDPDPWADKRIWGQFAIIEEVYNDPYGGFHGVDRSKLVKPAGFGFYTN